MASRNRSNLPDMASLTAVHRGYQYQDLLVACRLVDRLLGTVVEARIDEKLSLRRVRQRQKRFAAEDYALSRDPGHLKFLVGGCGRNNEQLVSTAAKGGVR